MIFIVIIINFIVIHLAPGNPVYVLAGQVPSQEFLNALEAKFGLDKPLHVQLGIYLWSVLHGDLGYSYLRSESVTSLIFERFPATLLLIFTAMIIALLTGIFLGVVASRKPYSLSDGLATSVGSLGVSIPTFWLGQILLILFAVYIQLFPVGGMRTLVGNMTAAESVLDILHHLCLPAITLAMFHLAFITRLTRSSMREILDEDFMVTARSKGLGDRAILYRHALRNALLPVVTYAGLNTGVLFAGAILTETVFSWPGMGTLLYQSLQLRDYPVILGIFVMVSVAVIAANLMVDILYLILDPRIR
jgi:peptide/nickel transport system permease protein